MTNSSFSVSASSASSASPSSSQHTGRPPAEAQQQPRVLVVTAVEAEQAAVQRGLQAGGRSADRFDVLAGGVGPASAAASTAFALAAAEAESRPYGLVLSAGIAGGFSGQAPPGSLVVASSAIAADLGAESAEGFLSVDELGFGSAQIAAAEPWSSRLAEALRQASLPVVVGPVLTASTVTGTAEKAEQWSRRHPGAAAEAMEGFGAATAAKLRGVPFVELRAISNAVGPRDRASWKIKEALAALEQASALFEEVF
ncbi:futalosine hydrolase [Paenibacillus senegalensis]|uniref:futalosine hydrolase n=1 Tax=Paenibacillus senegalensis TaxID=1465766 RepID=UPI000289DA08|nr:futalosine hydrolase [Paenibacillus senegalensis]